MPSFHYDIAVSGDNPDGRIGLRRAAELSGMHPEMILEFVRAEFVHAIPQGRDGMPRFSNEDIDRLRQIERLRSGEHANLRTICYILRLLDQLETTRHELWALQRRIGRMP